MRDRRESRKSSHSNKKRVSTRLACPEHGIRCPVLLVWGDHDRMLPHTGARLVLGSLPTTRVELIEGCGPRPQLEATGRLLELLLPFPR